MVPVAMIHGICGIETASGSSSKSLLATARLVGLGRLYVAGVMVCIAVYGLFQELSLLDWEFKQGGLMLKRGSDPYDGTMQMWALIGAGVFAVMGNIAACWIAGIYREILPSLEWPLLLELRERAERQRKGLMPYRKEPIKVKRLMR